MTKHMSHPSWVCGLKQYLANMPFATRRSHPSWVCGLKHPLLRGRLRQPPVTPFVGVWIETSANSKSVGLAKVTPFVGVWIETGQWLVAGVDWKVTPFVGVWIETQYLITIHVEGVSHTLRGCVD